ncbi:hypothetical protein D3C79_1023060 [compost metagenome]
MLDSLNLIIAIGHPATGNFRSQSGYPLRKRIRQLQVRLQLRFTCSARFLSLSQAAQGSQLHGIRFRQNTFYRIALNLGEGGRSI